MRPVKHQSNHLVLSVKCSDRGREERIMRFIQGNFSTAVKSTPVQTNEHDAIKIQLQSLVLVMG